MRHSYNIRYLLMATMLMVSIASSLAASIKISLRRGEAAPVANERFYVEVAMEDVNGELPRIKADGAKTLYQTETGTSSSTVIINGRQTSHSTRIYTITLRADREGKVTIQPITVGGVRSNTLTVNVGKADSRSGRVNSGGGASSQDFAPDQQSASGSQSGPRFIGRGNDNLFMVASVSKTSAYEQEALVYTVKLYSSFASLRFIGATESPKFDGFTLEDTNPKVESLHFESYKGRQYACAVIARYIIFPQMKGKLTIKGNRYTVTAESRAEYWDPFWGPLSYGRPVQLSVQPNDLTIDVKALPQPQPANFSGGVGHFSIKASMPTTKLATNQAASVVYTVTGSGNIKYVSLPDLAMIFPKEFEVSTPSPEVKSAPNGNTVTGSAKFDCSVMPLEEGQYVLPAVELVYFNPENGRYETARSQEFRVNVVKGKAGAESTGTLLRFDNDLMPYKDKLARAHHFGVDSNWYWITYAILFVIAAAILGGVVSHRRRHADAEGLMARRARRMADRMLRHARKSLKAGDRDHFFDNVLTALWGYAAHKLRMPGSEMQRQLVEANFSQHQVSQPVIDRFIALLDRCEEAKYAGAGMDMQQVYNEAAEVIRTIDTEFKK